MRRSTAGVRLAALMRVGLAVVDSGFDLRFDLEFDLSLDAVLRFVPARPSTDNADFTCTLRRVGLAVVFGSRREAISMASASR